MASIRESAALVVMSLSVYLGCDSGGGRDAPNSDETAADAAASSSDARYAPPLDAASPCPTPQQVDMLDDIADTWTALVDLGADGVCTLVADSEFTLDTVVFHDDELDEQSERYFIYAVQPWSFTFHDSGCVFSRSPSERLECSAGQSEGPKRFSLVNLDDLRAVDMTTSMDRDAHRLTLVALSVE